MKIKTTDGALITKIIFNAPAYNAGLAQYDVVTAINGKAIKNSDELIKKVKTYKIGDVIQVTVSRNGKPLTIDVEVGDKGSFTEQLQR